MSDCSLSVCVFSFIKSVRKKCPLGCILGVSADEKKPSGSGNCQHRCHSRLIFQSAVPFSKPLGILKNGIDCAVESIVQCTGFFPTPDFHILEIMKKTLGQNEIPKFESQNMILANTLVLQMEVQITNSRSRIIP